MVWHQLFIHLLQQIILSLVITLLNFWLYSVSKSPPAHETHTRTIFMYHVSCISIKIYAPISHSHFFEKVTLSCPTGDILQHTACLCLTLIGRHSCLLSVSIPALPPAQVSTLHMLSSILRVGLTDTNFPSHFVQMTKAWVLVILLTAYLHASTKHS